MKLLLLLTVCALPGFALAQESDSKPKNPEPAKPILELAPLPPPPATPPALEDTLPKGPAKPGAEPAPSLVPDTIPPARLPGRIQAKSTQKPPTTAADLDARIRFRDAHTKASNDPKIQALWDESRRSVTEFAKREALKRYYLALFQRINATLNQGKAPDKLLVDMVAERQRVSLRRLEQTRIVPTESLDEEQRANR